MQIRFVIRDEQGGKVGLHLQLDITLCSRLRSYCEKRQASRLSIMFVFQGERVDDELRPAELGLRNGDVIDAVVVDISMGNLITQLSSSSALQQEHAAWALGVGGIGTTSFGDNLVVTAEAILPLLRSSPTPQQCKQRQLRPWH